MLAFGIFLFVLFIPVVAVLLLVWAVVAIFSFLKWILSAMFGGGARSRPAPVLVPVRCARPRCHADNPAHATYCRRCGQPVGEPFVLRAA